MISSEVKFVGYMIPNWLEGLDSTYAGLDKLMVNSPEVCSKCLSFRECRTESGYTRLVGSSRIMAYSGDISSGDCILKVEKGKNFL